MMIEVKVEGLFLTQSQASGVILKEIEGERTLPIVIGDFEAQSIALGLENIEAPRPITHDLIIRMLDTLKAGILKIEITALKQNTFYALIYLEDSTGLIFEIDARPSDAIALAVRLDLPLFVEDSVFEKGGYAPNQVQYYHPQQKGKSIKDRLAELEEQLKKAIDEEKYELAAKLQEQIRQIKNTG
jgi:bifunctional DNase/RNase